MYFCFSHDHLRFAFPWTSSISKLKNIYGWNLSRCVVIKNWSLKSCFRAYCANIINGRRLRLLTLSSTLLGESGNVVCERVVCIALPQCIMQCKVIFFGIFSLISNTDYSIMELQIFTNKISFCNDNPRGNRIYLQNQYIIFDNAPKWSFKMPIIISGLQCRARQVLV